MLACMSVVCVWVFLCLIECFWLVCMRVCVYVRVYVCMPVYSVHVGVYVCKCAFTVYMRECKCESNNLYV